VRNDRRAVVGEADYLAARGAAVKYKTIYTVWFALMVIASAALLYFFWAAAQ
jgi:hypothetical protein